MLIISWKHLIWIRRTTKDTTIGPIDTSLANPRIITHEKMPRMIQLRQRGSRPTKRRSKQFINVWITDSSTIICAPLGWDGSGSISSSSVVGAPAARAAVVDFGEPAVLSSLSYPTCRWWRPDGSEDGGAEIVLSVLIEIEIEILRMNQWTTNDDLRMPIREKKTKEGKDRRG